MTVEPASGASAQPDSATLDAVGDVMAARAREYARTVGAAGSNLKYAGVERFRHSVLLLYDFTSVSGQGVVVKLYRGVDGQRAAATEYHNLKALADRSPSGASLRVPRALDHLDELDAVVMERIYAPGLDRTIRSEASRFRAVPASLGERGCVGAGTWLRTLLQIESPDGLESGIPYRDPTDYWRFELEEMLRAASELGISARLVTELSGVFGDRVDSDQPGRVLHSDFAPYNVCASANSLFVLDFSEMPIGVGDQCAGFFWSWLEMSKLHPLLSSGVLSRCQDAFQDGYGREISAYWRCWGMVRHVSYLEPVDARDSWPIRGWKKHRLRRLEAWLQKTVSDL